MKTLYITEYGITIRQNGESLYLYKSGKLINKIHTEKLEDIFVYGSVSITPTAIKYILSKNINLVYLTSNGEYIGRLIGKEPKNIDLRIAQYKKFFDDKFKLAFVKKIVFGKLYNYRTLLLRLNRKLNNNEISNVLFGIRNCIIRLEKSETIEQAMGYEGRGSALYFSVFSYFFNNKFIFVKRTKRPPLDPVNSMLSFGYTLLFNQICNLIYINGLDIMLGNLHSVEYGRASLALDLMEEFRPIIVDSIIINIVAHNILKPSDFQASEELPCVMSDSARKKFITIFENKLNARVRYGKDNILAPYRKVIELQIRSYIKLLTDEIFEYSPVLLR